MDWNSELTAAWAQALLSALAILVSGAFAIWVPIHMNGVAARERQIRAINRVRYGFAIAGITLAGAQGAIKAGPGPEPIRRDSWSPVARMLAPEMVGIGGSDLPKAVVQFNTVAAYWLMIAADAAEGATAVLERAGAPEDAELHAVARDVDYYKAALDRQMAEYLAYKFEDGTIRDVAF